MRISTHAQNKAIRFLVSAFTFYLCLVSFYINIGQDMAPENYLLCLPPTIAALFLLQYATKNDLFSRHHLPHILVGIAWCVTFPLLYAWSYDTAWYISKIRIDFLCGTGIFLLLTVLETWFFLPQRYTRFWSAIFAILDFLCLLIPLTEIAYYAIYQHCLTPASLMALYLTNPQESMDFIHANVGLPGLLALTLALFLFLWLAYRGNYSQARHLARVHLNRPKKIALAALTVLLLSYVPFFLFPETSIMTNWAEVSQYVKDTQTYSTHYQERFNGLQLAEQPTLAQKAPGTVIVVIGESASRNYMKTYTPDFPYEDTPWLESRTRDQNFVVYRNAYSSWAQTVPVLQRALTEQSQYNDKQFFESTSIIDIAKKAGYDTYWFSNQGRYGQYDSAITLVAKTADHAEWTDDSYVFTDKYDGSLLQYLPTVDPTKNNFIVIHIMGSHIYYNNRYPADFNKWENENGGAATNMESYANSILYTDAVLKQIYEYARDNLHLQAMVYFSDHGEDLQISHNPDVFKFDMVRIPMFVYMSPSYKAALPLQANALQHNEQQYFTNDMIYDTVCGILNAPSNHYDAGQDFSSASYRFNQQNLTTMLGEHSLMEDMPAAPGIGPDPLQGPGPGPGPGPAGQE